MTSGEVLEAMRKLGIQFSRSSLLRYEKWGLVSGAERSGGGRGVGRITLYPDDTAADAFASYNLMHSEYQISPVKCKQIRDEILKELDGKLTVDPKELTGLFHADWMRHKINALKKLA